MNETKNAVNKMYYVSTDHLSSINCVCKKPPTSSLLSQRISVIYSSKLTKFVVSKASNLPISYQTQNVLQNNKNSNGNVVDDLSYDVCSVKLGFCEQSETKAIVELIPSSEANREGRNRNPVDWSYSNFTLSSITDRGYTSHEQLSNFGLINMNGRVYDPMTLGFLSPDPFVQNPSNSQNFNRFSYVLNNPLKYVDPSGYMVWDPWFETMINGNRFFKEFPEMFENFRDKNGNLWKLRDDMKFSDENGNVFLRKIDEGLYVEIAKYQEIQEKLRQYNSQFENADFGFIAGAGVFRVEGEMQGGKYSLLFDGNNLKVINESTGNLDYSTIATSGKGSYMNNPKYQNIADKGPIPQGDYYFKKSQWNRQSTLRQVYNIVRRNGDWGEYNAPLTPINYQGDRHSFYIHGGFFKGSAGCIDAGLNIDKIYEKTNQQNTTRLRVRY